MHQQLHQRGLGRHSHAAKQQHLQQQRVLLPSPPCRLQRLPNARASNSSKEPEDTPAVGSSTSSSNNKQPSSLQDVQPAAAAPAGAPGGSGSSSSSSLQDVLSEAKQELQSSLSLLKDAAGRAFIPGYQPSSSSSTSRASSSRPRAFRSYSSLLNSSSSSSGARTSALQPDDVESVPARLQRLLTGQFIREAQGSSSSNSKQPFDARLAAMQFELQAQLQAEEAATQQQQQQPVQGVDTPGVVIDVVPEPLSPQDAQAAGVTAAAASSSAAAAAAAAADAGATAESAEQQQQTETYPATTYMLAIATWAVFLMQWWPALPELWKLLQQGGLVKAATALLFMYPDTASTQALCLDLAKVQAGSGLPGFITAGLLHSGLAATWLYSSALTDSGRWLEIGWGPMELLTTYILTSICASFAHMVAGSTMVGVTGAGAVMGVYTTWFVLAVQHLSQDVPTARLGVNVGVLLLLSLGLGVVQPAIGAASVVGGMLGGALAVKLAVPLAAAFRWGLSMPVLLLLFVLRMGIDALKLALLALVPLIAAAVQGVVGVVQAVRKV